MQKLRDCYYLEFEIQNHNLLVLPNNEVRLINQSLPLQYRAEYVNIVGKSVYEEDEYEANERLLVKKVVFLIMGLVTEEGVSSWSEVVEKTKGAVGGKGRGVQAELFRLACHMVSLMKDKPHLVSLAWVLDRLKDLQQPPQPRKSRPSHL